MGILTGDRREETFEALAAAEIIAELKNLGTVITGLRTAVKNNVLATETVVFDATNSVERTYPQNYRSVAVSNLGAATITVTSAPRQSSTPLSGVGVHRIGPDKSAVINMQGATLSIYGTEGQAVSFQIFDKTQPPSFG